MNVLVTAAASLHFAAALAQQPQHDWLIVPGERVGPITAATSAAMLETIFGASNVEPVDVQLGEGFTEPGTAVYPGDATQRIEVVWRDETRTAAKEIRLTGDFSKWTTSEGISLGTTLKEIERLNGFPFRLFGFAFDYGGTIASCGRGRLRILGCVDGDGTQQGRLVVLRLAPTPEAMQMWSEYRQVIGEKVFSSGHPAMQALNPSVYQMIVPLDR